MSDIDHAAVYRGVRLRLAALVCELSEEALDVIAPATPEWRVRDVLAHLAGATADITSGNLADVASDEWTSVQVDARKNLPIGAVLDEWARCSALVEPMIATLDRRALCSHASRHRVSHRSTSSSTPGSSYCNVPLGATVVDFPPLWGKIHHAPRCNARQLRELEAEPEFREGRLTALDRSRDDL